MNRREFLATGVGGALGVHTRTSIEGNSEIPVHGGGVGNQVRDLFPRLGREVFLNAAGGTPLGRFAESGLRRYENYWRLGPDGGRSAYVTGMLEDIRGNFAALIGAQESEIGLVHCTKAGEQIVLDGLPALRGVSRGNVVTNDLHFSGSLHNLVGLRESGLDVRIVRAKDWDVDIDAMEQAIDDRTALVTVTLVSNINGRIEPMRELADIAHAHGAYVYADIIQAAGIAPIDVHSLGIDFAACSGYKWLYGPHGVGFLFVRQELQGTVLPDYLFPGHSRPNYSPWVERANPDYGDFSYAPPLDARRYQPGHVSYLGYCALHEGLKFIDGIGVEEALRHSVRLIQRLKDEVDPERYPCISPHVDRSPIITFTTRDPAKLEAPLRSANVVIALSGNQLRVSPAIFNTEEDVDLLADVLNRA